MSLAVNDIIRITALQVFLSQQMLNVFFYKTVAVPTPSGGDTVYDELLDGFNTAWGIPTRAAQSSSCQHLLYKLENLTNGIDIAEKNLTATGDIAGDQTPSFTAFNVKLVRTTAITRNGSKRIGGLPESAVTGNGINLSGSAFTNLQNAQAAPLLDPVEGVQVAIPVIIGRVLVDGDYVLDLSKVNPIQGAVLSTVSTQRSRKLGRGI